MVGPMPFEPEALCEAISKREVVRLTYRGVSRLIEPYLHGFASDGTEMIMGYQRDGGSSSGQRSGWKAMRVGQIEILRLTGITFIGSQLDYRPGGSKNIARVHCGIAGRG